MENTVLYSPMFVSLKKYIPWDVLTSTCMYIICIFKYQGTIFTVVTQCNQVKRTLNGIYF